MTHLDTSFLVDVLREVRRGRPGRAMALRERLAEEPLGVSVHVVCELMAGAELSRHPSQERRRVLRLCDAVEVVYPDDGFAALYGRLLTALQRNGKSVGTMDLLIATAAVRVRAPLVTGNVREFSRIPELEVVGY